MLGAELLRALFNLTKQALSSLEACCVVENKMKILSFWTSHTVAKCCCNKPQDTLEATDREMGNIYILLK